MKRKKFFVSSLHAGSLGRSELKYEEASQS
jgi:hypothetical protein